MKNDPEVLKWFNSNRDFNLGMTLLRQYSSKTRMLTKLQKDGPTRYSTEKLTYELWKLTTLPEKARHKKVSIKISSSSTRTHSTPVPSTLKGQYVSPTLKRKHDPKEIPQVVRDIIKEYKDLNNKRSRAHLKLHKIPHDNLAGHVRQRSGLVNKIAGFTDRIEFLYPHKNNYFTKDIIPEVAVVFPGRTNLSDIFKNLPGIMKIRKLNSLNVQLSRLKKKVANMPDGPKRRKLNIEATDIKKQLTILNDILDKA